MAVYRSMLAALLALLLFSSCKSKKKPVLSGEEPVEVADFISFFPETKLPYAYGDTSLVKKEKDSLLISNKIFKQFVPDSLLDKAFGKGAKPKIYALARTRVPKAEQYLFIKTVAGDKRGLFVLCFDKGDKYIAGMPVLRPDRASNTSQSFVLDRRFSLTKSVQRRNADGSVNDGKDVYVLNADAKNFMLIMTDALDERVTELLNPIDTLPRKHKWSADYGNGKMNLVSIRDGRKPDRISFFVHFEKNNGECTGELKGEAFIKAGNTAEYRENGDPCILLFSFSGNSVSLRETNCGSRRGLACSFDGSFPRRKWVKPVNKSEKKSPQTKAVKK